MSVVEYQSCHRRDERDPFFREFQKTGNPPRCPCGGYLKSATISFGKSLRPDELERASAAAAQADLVMALGSTLSVIPAAYVPLQAAMRGVPYVIINRGQTEHDHYKQVTLRLEGDVGELFHRAVDLAF